MTSVLWVIANFTSKITIVRCSAAGAPDVIFKVTSAGHCSNSPGFQLTTSPMLSVVHWTKLGQWRSACSSSEAGFSGIMSILFTNLNCCSLSQTAFWNVYVLPLPILKKTGLDSNDVKSHWPVFNLLVVLKAVGRITTHQVVNYLQSSASVSGD